MMRTSKHAFTLVELLVVISIITLLIAILLPVVARARENAKRVRELSAARSTAQAYIMRATEHGGELLEGYSTTDPGYAPSGERIGGEPAKRYPWRLMRYIDYRIEGSILTNEQADSLGSPPSPDGPDYGGWLYQVSVSPSFGLNYHNVGGRTDNPGYNSPGMIQKISQAAAPSRLIVFASARMDTMPLGQYVHGFFRVTSPNDLFHGWPEMPYSYEAGAFVTGNVDPRWNDRAVVANLDGHAELLSVDELRDMTRWNNQAAKKNEPNWDPWQALEK